MKRGELIMLVAVIIMIAGLIFFLGDSTLRDSGAPSSPIKIDLSMSQPPSLEETAEITIFLTYLTEIKENLPNVSMKIILPEGLELVEGNPIWEGEIENNISYSIIVKSIEVGNWTIEGNARAPPEGETYFGGRGFIYLTITENSAWINKERFREIKECPPGVNCGTTEPPN